MMTTIKKDKAMTDLRQILAANIKFYRGNLGISQAKLAKKTFTTENYIAMLESGKRFPSIYLLERIAEVLQRDTLDLFFQKKTLSQGTKSMKKSIMTDIEAILTERLNETDT